MKTKEWTWRDLILFAGKMLAVFVGCVAFVAFIVAVLWMGYEAGLPM